MTNILDEICARKRDHIADRKAILPLAEVRARAADASPPRGFLTALSRRRQDGAYGFICEIKKASPSKGLIRADFDPPALAAAYEAGGAACLSVLTDEPYFQGRDAYLTAARAATSLPCLRKDFMLDAYQIHEARMLGADCILLILSALDDGPARNLEALALSLGMDVLIEVHDKAEMERALTMESPLVGINNRNLKTMSVSLDTTLSLAAMAAGDTVLVAESGLASTDDLARCASAGAGCFLIGETFMRQPDVAAAVRALQKPSGAGAA
ncbi:indole-3-glycerol phosphate synthase TrpC [Eilatimonas milleporae]|uniref:Indole-3-glycerol phosphate synthase n=1 Tax=Eilatimonas milleporae TaxID=911205 RepID=A0A3M0CPK9_9PROT|nr:indole-3-glycerol phosphate synthase TrpC [Eilatimonas milleporae]RMB08799.1 indole-3-glycerol phosphate synthase [Eilatimonas milleporae]